MCLPATCRFGQVAWLRFCWAPWPDALALTSWLRSAGHRSFSRVAPLLCPSALRCLGFFFAGLRAAFHARPIAWRSVATEPFLLRCCATPSCFHAGVPGPRRCDRYLSGGFPFLPRAW